MDTWRTAIVDAGPHHIRVRGHDVLDLMRQSTFTDLIFLLHHNRLPSPGERRMLDAILIGVADHGAGAPSCCASSRPAIISSIQPEPAPPCSSPIVSTPAAIAAAGDCRLPDAVRRAAAHEGAPAP